MSVNRLTRWGRKILRDNHRRLMVLGVILLLFTISGGIAHADLLSWAKQADSDSTGIAVDGNGNIYVTGLFGPTATFGAGEPNETILNSAGYTDCFVAKYNSWGGLIWAKQRTNGAGTVFLCRGIAVNSWSGNDSIYMTGEYTHPGDDKTGEIFLNKSDIDGNFIWTIKAENMNNDPSYGQGIVIDSDNKIHLTGVFIGPTIFGAGEQNTTFLNSNIFNMFVAKYYQDGRIMWAKQLPYPVNTTFVFEGPSIAVDFDTNSYVTYNQPLPNGTEEMFVAKYDRSGVLIWTKVVQGESWADSIAADVTGNSYVTGFIKGTATFGKGEPNETTLNRIGYIDGFVAKYDSNGNIIWAKQAGGTEAVWGRGIAVDRNGNSYVTGNIKGTVTFGKGETNETTLNSIGYIDGFVAKYDSNGNIIWAKQAVGTNDLYSGIAIDGSSHHFSSGNIYVTGGLYGTATFGAGEPNETTLVSIGSHDFFVAKYVPEETPTGSHITASPVDPQPVVRGTSVQVTFDYVSVPGSTTATSSPSGTPLPTGFSLGNPPVYFDIHTTATFGATDGLPIQVCIKYTGITFVNESSLRLYHREGGVWKNVTTSLDTANDILCGEVSSLSTFATGEVENNPPVANPTATPNTGDAPLTVQFAANALDQDGDVLTYAWDFGDTASGSENISTLANPSHIYDQAGTYNVWLTVSDGKTSPSPTYLRTVTVEPKITLSVRLAIIKNWNKQKTMGFVTLWADLDTDQPAPDDVYTVWMDGVRLFSQPFSAFKKGILPGAYVYTGNGMLVRLDPANHRLLVVTPNLSVTGINNSNGVDVEVMVGDATAVENIKMTAAPLSSLIYRRKDVLGDPQ